uniref:Evasin n=1 Tax=Rhipicephalus pulchellus TaxID=72859 RepID=L7MC83_RHIPC
MAFKACITIISLLYAVQLLCGAEESFLGGAEEVGEEEEDYEDSCMYGSMKTNDTWLAINCTVLCGTSGTVTEEHVPNNAPCVNLTTPPLNYNHTDAMYMCTVGACTNGTCPSKHKEVPCWL